ncbi:methyl-accepting chemotaxis protein [candidate division CSSED10-310 bacterium]|uniref:Methyl-accepting chemotaxis protein n=1 Tax=candidate division CSSED10-310 bacterium TaxID=2855610 RepID=A0ABV6YVV8_UNCC1
MKKFWQLKLQPGTQIRLRFNLKVSITAVIGIIFILFYIKETLLLEGKSLNVVVDWSIIIGILGLGTYIGISTYLLREFISFLNSAPKSVAIAHERLRELAQGALILPVRIVTLSLIMWFTSAVSVGIISYLKGAIVFEDVLVIVNTVLFFTIILNMYTHRYVKEIGTAVIHEVNQRDQSIHLSPSEFLGSVKGKTMIFVGSIIIVLILFFLQLNAVTTLRQSKDIIFTKGKSLFSLTKNQAYTISEVDLVERAKLFRPLLALGYQPPFLVSPTQGLVAGDAGQSDVDMVLYLFRTKKERMISLFAPIYLYITTESGDILALKADWREFDLSILSFSSISFFFIGCIILFSLHLGRRISFELSSSLVEITHSLREISLGEGDLTKKIKASSYYETAQLAQWFNEFVQQLSDIISQSQALSMKINLSTKLIDVESTEIMQEILAQENMIEIVAASAQGFKEQSTEISKNLEGVSYFADDSYLAAEQGIKSMQILINGITQIRETAEVNATVLEYLSSKSEAIQEIIESVDVLADQTRLLAFTAMLETVGVGSAASRFGVVAESVRGLADEFTDYSDKIKKITIEILDTLKNLVKTYEVEQSEIDQLATDIEKSNDDLNRIGTLSEKAASSMKDVMTKSVGQREFIEESVQNIGHLIESFKKIFEYREMFMRVITSLQSKTDQLEETIRKFKIDEDLSLQNPDT